MHRNSMLHLGNFQIHPHCPTIKGSEDGRASKACSGRKRCLPRFQDLLGLYTSRKNRIGAWVDSSALSRMLTVGWMIGWNQSSNQERSGQCGLVHSSLTLAVAREITAASLSISLRLNCHTIEDGSPGESSTSEGISPPSNASIDSSSPSRVLSEKLSSHMGESPNSSKNSTRGYECAEEREARGDSPWGNSPVVTPR